MTRSRQQTVRWRQGWWLLLAATLILGLQWVLPEAPEQLWPAAWHDAAHIPWFAAFSVAVAAWSTRFGWPRWCLPVLLLGLAAASELLQQVPDGADLTRNLLGATLGWWLWCWRRQRLVCGGLAVLVVALTVTGPLLLLYAKQQRTVAPAVVFDASQPGWRLLVSATGDSDWSVGHTEQTELGDQRRVSLAVVVNERPWSGVRLRELDQDWRSYRELQIDVSLEATQPLVWYVGTRHQGDSRAGATRSVRVLLQPGLQRLRLPLSALTPGPDGASRVQELLLYSEPEFAGRRWHLLAVTLQ